MINCEHCQNPVKELWRSQCMWAGAGTPPCESEQYASDKRRTQIGCYLLALIAAGTLFTFWQLR